jgi:2-deoxy-D-gluconate 3-dehydrogenase
VNNAGLLRKPAAEYPDEYWDTIIETNVNSQFLLSREIGKRMIRRKRGKIIFVDSLLSLQGGINVPGYAASKGAIAQLTKALSNEWAALGVQVNAIAPGYICTDNTAALQADSERSAAILSRIPAGRWGTPHYLQGAVVFLASSASDYVNGTVLVVDGGWMGR